MRTIWHLFQIGGPLSPLKGIVGLLDRGLGLIEGRLRAGPCKNCMAVPPSRGID